MDLLYDTGTLDLDQGDKTPARCDADGNLKVVIGAAGTLPTGAATAANQATGNAYLAQIAGATEYETVAASQTDQMLGGAGAAGDYLAGLLVIPATTSPGGVSIENGATNIPVFVGGADSVSNLVPFFVPLGIASVGGGWEITTGANVSVIAVGNFTA